MASKDNTSWVLPESMDSTAHLDLIKARPAPALPRLKPSTTSMNLRVPVSLLEQLKQEANRRDVPYQSLVKILLQEKLASLHSR
ncbi:MAG: CopG family antitoxin [Terrimicrobiaceae bacterium]